MKIDSEETPKYETTPRSAKTIHNIELLNEERNK
jgi:hypothetical protein